MKINAAVLEELGKPLLIKSIDTLPLIPGQVLIKVLFSGVCRSQLMEVNGKRGLDSWLPHLLGHEGSGIVQAISQGVTKVKVGDEVILSWVKGDGMEAPGARYKCGDQIINSGCVTTFSNYSIISENRLVIKPKSLPFDIAVLYGCALPTGAGMVLNEIKPSVDTSIIVLGLGGIGLSALMALKALNVKMIIAVDISDEKLILAKELGATHTFNTMNDNIQQDINKLTDGGADRCIESAGLATTIELGFSLIQKKHGRLLFASHPPDGEMIKIAPHELISGKSIDGSWGGSTMPDKDIPIMYNLFHKSDAPLGSLLAKRYKLEEINEALADLVAGRVFRPLIVMEHPVQN